MGEGARRRLMADGFYTVETAAYGRLSEPISSHPDMLFFYNGGELISSADYCDAAPYIFEDVNRLTDTRLIFTDELTTEEYPGDVLFNALVIGGKIFLREESISRAVLDHARRLGLETVGVRQGYPACTTLALGDRAAITADPGMAKALSENGIRVYLIENGDISLPPYEYGFIGGSAGVYRDKIYFTGDARLHRSGDIILSACYDAGLAPVFLSDEPLTDLGRIVFIE